MNKILITFLGLILFFSCNRKEKSIPMESLQDLEKISHLFNELESFHFIEYQSYSDLPYDVWQEKLQQMSFVREKRLAIEDQFNSESLFSSVKEAKDFLSIYNSNVKLLVSRSSAILQKYSRDNQTCSRCREYILNLGEIEYVDDLSVLEHEIFVSQIHCSHLCMLIYDVIMYN